MSTLSESSTNETKQNVSMSNENMEQHTLQELTRETIEAMSPQIRKTDEDQENGLELFCYVKCSSSDTELMRQCRGIVFNDKKIVMRAFPYTIEYTHEDSEAIEKYIQPEFAKCEFYDAHEGALIRMFNFNGKWYTSTHRKLNAFRSKWASIKSFGDYFMDALKAEVENNSALRDSLPAEEESKGEENSDTLLSRFQTILDTDKQYMFLVRHSAENRIVCDAPERPTLYHVGTFVDGNLVMTEDIKVPYPRKLSFLSMDDLIDHVNKIDIRNLQGVIVFAPSNVQYKIFHSDYRALFDARGNEPSIKFRYLQVRMNPEQSELLKQLYPEKIEVFEEYENILYNVAKKIYHSYVQRHIKGNWSTLPQEEYVVDKVCHMWHEEDRKNNRISLEKIIQVMNEQPPTNLNKMIRHYREDEIAREKGEEPKEIKITPRSKKFPPTKSSKQTRTFKPRQTKPHQRLLKSNRFPPTVTKDVKKVSQTRTVEKTNS